MIYRTLVFFYYKFLSQVCMFPSQAYSLIVWHKKWQAYVTSGGYSKIMRKSRRFYDIYLSLGWYLHGGHEELNTAILRESEFDWILFNRKDHSTESGAMCAWNFRYFYNHCTPNYESFFRVPEIRLCDDDDTRSKIKHIPFHHLKFSTTSKTQSN